jgi:phenylacetate-coenzyme A ligase PaaK-like adenylate-forming protein
MSHAAVAERVPEISRATALTLRAGVKLARQGDGSILSDELTGLRLLLGQGAASVIASLEAHSRPPANDASGQFLSQLDALGLFEPATPSEARRAQGAYVLSQANDNESERLRITVERAARTTALHREHLGSALADGWQFDELPRLRKHDIRRHFPSGLITDGLDLSALLHSRDLMLATTSGSTGERLQVYSDTRIPRLPPNALEFWRLQGVATDRPLRTAVFTSPTCSGTTCSSRLPIAERISFEHTLFLQSPRNPFRLRGSEVREILEEMHEFQADFWLVNPVYLAALAERAADLGLHFPRVTAILYTYQYFSHCQRRAFARRFDAPVFALYTATELAGSQIGVGCPEGNLHVRLDQVFVELLDDGKPVLPTQLGAVTVTSHNETMPLVRYALGDLARMGAAPCACSVGSDWPILVLEGRERDAFVTASGRITSKAVDDCLEALPLAMYQLSETAPGQYLFEAILERGASREWRDAAEAALSSLLTPQALVLEEVSELSLDESQKFRFTKPLARGESAP